MTNQSKCRWAVQLGLGLLLFTVIEGALRLAVPPPKVDYPALYRLHGADGFAMLEREGLSVALLDSAASLIREDPTLLWRVRPGLDTTVDIAGNRWSLKTGPEGFRDDDSGGDWLALGDSCTFGWGTDTDLAQALEAHGKTVENRAVPGFSVLQGEALSRPADVLLVNFGANDGHQVLRDDATHLRARRSWSGQLRHRIARLHTVRHARNVLYRPWAHGTVMAWEAGAYRSRVAPADFEAALHRLAATAQRTVLLRICARDEYGKAMQRVARDLASVDLVVYDGETVDGCHPTAEGHAQLAQEILALF